MSQLPTGTVTFLFTDIEGSTPRWEQHPAAMKAALDQHDTLMRTAFAAHGGTVFQTAGDSFVVVFTHAAAALAAALAAQRALRDAAWAAPIGPLRVRAALHSGPGEQRADGYHAEFTLNRLARLLAAGHGGQILVTDTTHQFLDGAAAEGVGWRDLGEHWLKDLIRPLHVYQVLAPDLPADFPPLKTLPGPGAVPTTGADLLEGAGLENPYKGLRAFQEADAADFFGREALTERLITRLGEAVPLARFLAVVGPSGSGKSSVIRAGLLPALRRGGLPGSEHWLLVEMIPGAEPLPALAAALGAATGQAPADLLADLQADEYGLVRVAQPLLTAGPSSVLSPQSSVLVVIDQFEEVFTLVADEPARVHFLESLHRAVTTPDSPVLIIVTLRADFYDRPLLYPDPGELLRQRTEVVLPLTPEELARAISSPAARVGVQVEAALVGAMIQDVAEQPGTLPLLEYVLTELFERREGNRLTLAAYRASGGLQAALGRRAEEIYAGLTAPQQEVARQVFLRLVTLGEGAEDTRRRVRRAELAALPGDPDTLDGVLETFSRYRLLTFDQDLGLREPTVEVAHEALLRAWERLREWLETSRADLRVQRQLQAEADEWARAHQDPSYLASGARLAQFEALAAGQALALTAAEQAYIAASVQERTRQASAEQARQAHELALARQAAAAQRSSANRLRGLLAGAVVFLVVAIGLSLFALDRSQAAETNAATAVARQTETDAQRLVAQGNAATAVARQTETDAQRQMAQAAAATAVTNEADAKAQRNQAQANFQRSEAQRLAAEANRLLGIHGNADLIALLSIRALHTQYSPQGDVALQGASKLDYPVKLITGLQIALLAALFSPDGKQLITTAGYPDGIAQLWDITTGMEVRRFTGHTGYIAGVAVSPDGQYLLTSSQDQTARLWEVGTGREVRHFTATVPLNAAAFSPDGRAVLVGSQDGAYLWDVQSGTELRRFGTPENGARAVAFSGDGKYVLIGMSDQSVRLWDVGSGAEVRRFTGHTSVIRSVAFSPDGRSILTGAGDNLAILWDLQTGVEVRRFSGHANEVTSAVFTSDGKTILTGSLDNTARIWNAATGAEVRRLTSPTGPVWQAVYSPDGRLIATASDDHTVRLWAAQGGGLPQFRGHSAGLVDAEMSPDGQYVLTASWDHTAALWDAHTGVEIRRLVGHTDQLTTAAFSLDGRQVLTGGYDRTARLWDVQTGQEIQRFAGHATYVSMVAFSPDGSAILTGEFEPPSGTIRLWDVQTGQEVRRFAGAVSIFAFSPDGKQMVAMAQNHDAVGLWDLATGAELRRFPIHTRALGGLAFAPDGQTLLTGSQDGTTSLWDVHTGQELRRFTLNVGSNSVRYSHDGKRILTASFDSTARLWDVQTGQELRRFAGPPEGLWNAAFSPNDRYILIAGLDGVARMYHADLDEAVRDLCGRLVRDFSSDERTAYGIPDQKPTCPQQ